MRPVLPPRLLGHLRELLLEKEEELAALRGSATSTARLSSPRPRRLSSSRLSGSSEPSPSARALRRRLRQLEATFTASGSSFKAGADDAGGGSHRRRLAESLDDELQEEATATDRELLQRVLELEKSAASFEASKGDATTKLSRYVRETEELREQVSQLRVQLYKREGELATAVDEAAKWREEAEMLRREARSEALRRRAGSATPPPASGTPGGSQASNATLAASFEIDALRGRLTQSVQEASLLRSQLAARDGDVARLERRARELEHLLPSATPTVRSVPTCATTMLNTGSAVADPLQHGQGSPGSGRPGSAIVGMGAAQGASAAQCQLSNASGSGCSTRIGRLSTAATPESGGVPTTGGTSSGCGSALADGRSRLLETRPASLTTLYGDFGAEAEASGATTPPYFGTTRLVSGQLTPETVITTSAPRRHRHSQPASSSAMPQQWQSPPQPSPAAGAAGAAGGGSSMSTAQRFRLTGGDKAMQRMPSDGSGPLVFGGVGLGAAAPQAVVGNSATASTAAAAASGRRSVSPPVRMMVTSPSGEQHVMRLVSAPTAPVAIGPPRRTGTGAGGSVEEEAATGGGVGTPSHPVPLRVGGFSPPQSGVTTPSQPQSAPQQWSGCASPSQGGAVASTPVLLSRSKSVPPSRHGQAPGAKAMQASPSWAPPHAAGGVPGHYGSVTAGAAGASLTHWGSTSESPAYPSPGLWR